MKKRQPVFHACMFAALAHRLIKRIAIIDRAECGNISRAEAAHRFLVQMNFARRHEIDPLELTDRALRRRIETADGVERVTEHVEPNGKLETGRIYIDNAATHSELTRLPHGPCPVVTVCREIGRESIEIDTIARSGRPGGRADRLSCWDALQYGIDSRYEDEWLFLILLFASRQARKGRHPPRADVTLR